MVGEKKNSNWGLVVLLCALLVAIVGLAVGIFMINYNNAPKEDSNSDDMAVSYDEYLSYIDEYDDVEKKFKELAAKNPVDTEEFISLTSEYIDKYVNAGDTDRASSFVQLVEEVLMDLNHKNELLEVMTSIDLDVFTEADRYRYYSAIIDIANDLGDDGIVQKYTPLRERVKAAYDAEYEGAKAARKEFGLD